jgi:origin recognition complex subunit 4
VDGKKQVLQGVSILELCLIIAMKRLIDRGDVPFNFEMIYNEYKLFAIKGDSSMVECYSKSVAFKVRERERDLIMIQAIIRV